MREQPMQGRVVAITGAGGGLGRALALEFARRRARIALLDRDPRGLEGTVAALAAADSRPVAGPPIVRVCDITDAAACDGAISSLIAEAGGLDILVNNAGLSQHGRADLTHHAVLAKVMDVNFHGAVHCTLAALPALRESRGVVAVMSSVAGFAPLYGRAAYAASKHALHGWFDTLRAELDGTGVDVTLITPSFVRTGIDANALSADGSPNRRDKPIVGKLASPEAIARRVVPAILARRPRVRPTAVSEVAWWLSRIAPGLYARIMASSQRRGLD